MPRQRKAWMYRDVLQGMYIEQELTLRQIAQILDSTPANILYWIRKFEIPTRSSDIGAIRRGKKMCDSDRERLSQIARERFKDKTNHPMYGKHHTESARKKISEGNKGKRKPRRKPCTQTDGPSTSSMEQ